MLQQRAVLAAASKMCWYIFALHACATTFTCGCLHLPPRHPLPNAQTHERETEEHQLAKHLRDWDCFRSMQLDVLMLELIRVVLLLLMDVMMYIMLVLLMWLKRWERVPSERSRGFGSVGM